MTDVIDVRFKAGGKAYSFNPNGVKYHPGQAVIVGTARGEEYGECVKGNHEVDETNFTSPLRPVLRLATEADLKRRDALKDKERECMRVCQEKIEHYGLDMKLVSCECALDGGKTLFFFTAEERVDFRELVKDLAATLHSRIELRQIGVRDETKLLGGLGICGQPFCCSRFLDRFQPVSIKMAKTQNLSLNPTKISGSCGRLMCCLKYEQGAYEDAVKRCPKKESFVETPDGAGTVVDVNYLRERVKVRLEEEASDAAPKQYLNQEIRVVRMGKGKRPEDYVAPPKSELEKLRYIPPKEERQERQAPKDSLAAALEELLGDEAKRSPTRKPSRSGGGGRSRRPQGGGKARQEQAQPKSEPKKEQAQPKGEGGSGRSRNRNRRRPKRAPGGEQG